MRQKSKDPWTFSMMDALSPCRTHASALRSASPQSARDSMNHPPLTKSAR
jgi:hypothetical protein